MGDAVLVRELRRLCKGRGLLGQDFSARLGPEIVRRIRESGLDEDEAHGRAAVSEWLGAWLTRLPDDLEIAARVAFGLHPEARDRFLSDRVQWLAETIDRDVRTVRRRVDEAIGLLADFMDEEGARVPPPRPGADPDGGPGWYFASVRAIVRLDLPSVEVLEERRIVVTAAALDTVIVEVSLPKAPGATKADLLADVMFGGVMRARERPSASHFRFVIGLPSRLVQGDQHDLAIRYAFPPGQPMAPHYTLVPLIRCDRFELRLKTAPGARPAIWPLDGVTPRTLDDPPGAAPEAVLDGADETRVEFSRLSLGHAYGFRWAER